MSLVFQYLIKLAISLGVVYLFYYFLLRRLTFYSANRWYLLLYSFSSFLIPLINIYPVLEKNRLEATGLINYIPSVATRISMNDPLLSKSIAYEDAKHLGQGLLIILLLGIVAMLLRLVVQYCSFLKVKRSSTLLLSDPIKVFQVNDSIIPFSIGNAIFINQHLHKEEELKEIIRHEFIHVKQKHSIDIFLAELLCVLNWYNPFAWLIRRAIKVNLEFIADNKVLEGGLDRREYQYLLLKVIGVSQFNITTQFNFSSLKKRIAMMNKKQSTKAQLLKLLLLLPILIVVLLAFRNAGRNMPWNFAPPTSNQADTIPGPPPPPKPVIPSQLVYGKEYNDFLQRNPEVKSAELKDNQLTIQLKSGGKEFYDLANEARFAAAEKKYGRLPLLPPPPPPPPPPANHVLPKDVKSISITETKATVLLSNGKQEDYDLTKPGELEAFQHKYQQRERYESLGEPGHELSLLEMKARQHEMMKLRNENHGELDRLMREYEMGKKAGEHEMMKLRNENHQQLDRLMKEYEMERMEQGENMEREMRMLSREKQKEMELLQKKYHLEAEREDEMRKKEFEKASKMQGADVEKLKRKYEMQRDADMAKREMELHEANLERETEMALLQHKLELDARNHQQLKEELLAKKEMEMLKESHEVQEKMELLQQKLVIDTKNLSKEEKKEVVSQLEVHKKELSKQIEALKAKELQINKQLQELKKKER